MSQEYQEYVALPLFAALGLLGLATGVILLMGKSLPYNHDRWEPSINPFVRETLHRFRWLLWVLLVTIVFLVANQLLVRGVAVGTWDVDGQFYPYYVLVADHARAARFIQWDPWSNGGLPILGDPQVGGLSPLNFTLGVMTGGTSGGFVLYWLLLWWLGGLGMLMLGRHLGAPSWGAGVVTLGFLFCGIYTGNAEHTSWVAAFSFLPLTIWRLDTALTSHTLRPAVEAGAVWGLSALSGYPGVIVITGCFAGLWTLGRWLASRSWGTRRGEGQSDLEAPTSGDLSAGFACNILGLFLVLGVVILSPTYFAFFWEGAGINPRAGALSRDIALGNSLEPGAVSTFASPYLAALKVVRQFLGPGVAPGELWPATDVSMVSIYAGAIIPSLALFALARRPRDGWRWWVAGLGVLSLACAMGESLPLRGWLYDWFFPMRFFRHSAIFRLYYVFALCVLALLATRDLATDLQRPRAPGHFLFASIVVAFCAVLGFAPFLSSAWTEGMPATAVLLGRLHFAWVWLGICAVAFLGWKSPREWRGWAVPLLLTTLAVSDMLLTSVLSMPTVLRVGAAADRWKMLDHQHRSTVDLTSNGWWRKESACEPDLPSVRCKRNDQLITKTPVFDAYSAEKNVFHLTMLHHPVLKDMAVGGERIWFSKAVAHVPPTEDAFNVFRIRAEALGAPPLVVHSSKELLRGRGKATSHHERTSEAGPNQVPAIARLPAAERVDADVVRYTPGELVFDVQTATSGWLLITDRWARSWRAELNGRSTTLYGGNFIFRAIQISAGPNRVRFTYDPLGFPWLVMVSWGTLGLVSMYSMNAWRRARTTRSDSSRLGAD